MEQTRGPVTRPQCQVDESISSRVVAGFSWVPLIKAISPSCRHSPIGTAPLLHFQICPVFTYLVCVFCPPIYLRLFLAHCGAALFVWRLVPFLLFLLLLLLLFLLFFVLLRFRSHVFWPHFLAGLCQCVCFNLNFIHGNPNYYFLLHSTTTMYGYVANRMMGLRATVSPG